MFHFSQVTIICFRSKGVMFYFAVTFYICLLYKIYFIFSHFYFFILPSMFPFHSTYTLLPTPLCNLDKQKIKGKYLILEYTIFSMSCVNFPNHNGEKLLFILGNWKSMVELRISSYLFHLFLCVFVFETFCKKKKRVLGVGMHIKAMERGKITFLVFKILYTFNNRSLGWKLLY